MTFVLHPVHKVNTERRYHLRARCAATDNRAAQRATQADDGAAGRRCAGTAAARWRTSKPKKVAASAPNRPPTSRPMMTRRHRRASVRTMVAAMASLEPCHRRRPLATTLMHLPSVTFRDLFVSCFSRVPFCMPQLAAIGELHANQAEITAHGQRLVRNASLVGVVLRTCAFTQGSWAQ